MDKPTRLRSPLVKRKSKILPVNQRVNLERVLGLTLSSNAGLTCDSNTGTIAYPAGCVVVLFNPKRKKQTHIFNSSKKTITAVAFSKDGKHLVTGEAGHLPAVRVWDVEDKSQVAEFHGHNFRVNCVAFFPNSKYIVSIGSQHDKMVNVWNWKTGNKVASNKISSKVSAVDFNEEGGCFVTVGHRHVKFWYLDCGKSKINAPRPLSGRNGILGDQKNNYFCDVACGRGKQASSTYCITQAGLLCEFNEKRLIDKWAELRTKSANCINVSEEYIFVGCAEGTVRIFSSQTLYFLSTIPYPHYLGVDVASAITPSHVVCNKETAKYPDAMAIAFDDLNRQLTCVYSDHSLYVWDVNDIKKVGKVRSFLYHSACIWGLDVYPVLDNNNSTLPPGSFLTSSGDDTVRVWNIEPQLPDNTLYKRNIYSNELLKIVYADPSYAFLCDGEYNQAGSTDKTDTTYDSKNGIRSIRVSPDGKQLATGDREGNIKIYDMHFMDDVRSIEAHDGDVLCLEYHYVPGGPKLLATASRDRLIHVFDAEQNYGLIQTLDDHSSSITAVKFASSDDKLKMLSCGADKSILFRNATMSPELQFNVDQHLASKATLYDMIIDPSHKFVATACQDRNVRIYSIAKAKQKKNYKGTQADDGVLLRLQLDPSGSYVATSCTDKSICIVDFYTGEVVATMYGHSEIVTGIQFTNDLKHIISVSSDGCIFIWKLSAEMTKHMRSRMDVVGKIPRETKSYDDLRRETNILPDALRLNIDDHIPVLDNQFKSPGKVLDIIQGTDTVDSGADKANLNLDYRFSVGELPNWAKVKMGDAMSETSDSSSEGNQPRGRWAQRADTNTSVYSQLDKSIDNSTSAEERRRFTSEANALQQQIADLRRETMVLNQQTNLQNIPIIDDDDVTNVDDEEEFFSSCINNRDSIDSDRPSWDPGECRSPLYSSNSLGRRLGGVGRKWGSRTSLNFDKNFTFEMEDNEDESRSDTPEVIYYPENDLDSVKSFGSSYSVFNKTNKPARKSGILDDDSESTEAVSLEDMEEEEDIGGLSNPSTPSEPDKYFLATTPDKEKFVKENFENVAFTPVAPEKFHKALDHLEEEMDSNIPRPFSPRLSISARFLSRAQQAGLRSTFAGIQKQENWFDPLQKSRSNMARAVDETRKRLVSMGWDGDDDIDDENKPPSPPTKLEANIHNFSKFDEKKTSPKSVLSTGQATSPTPKSPRRFWLTTNHSKLLRDEGLSLPKIPISKYMRTQIAVKTFDEEDEDALSTSSSSSSIRLRGSQPNLRNVRHDDKRRSTPNLRSSPVEVCKSPEGGKRGSGGVSYLRPTKSSKAKNLRSSSTSLLPGLGASTEVSQTNGLSKSTSLSNLITPKEEPQNNHQKRTLRKGKLSSSKLAQYASTPNLASVEEDDEEEPPTNLVNLGHLTKSVPDVNDLDTNSTASSNENHTNTLPTRRPNLRSRLSGLRKDRDSGGASIDKRVNKRSLSIGDRLSTDGHGQVRRSLSPSLNQNGKPNNSNGIMPPPLSSNVSRKKQPDSILKHSIKRRSQTELTLDEAKDILMGRSKSGREYFTKDSNTKKLNDSVNKSAEKPSDTNPKINMNNNKKDDSEEEPLPSVKDRIAKYYSHLTPDSKTKPEVVNHVSNHSPHNVTSVTTLNLNTSSHSQSDTGVESDTECEIKRPDKTTHHPRLSLVTVNQDIDNSVSLTTPVVSPCLDSTLSPVRINRSKLSLPVTPDYNSQDFLSNCSEAVADLEKAIQKLKQIHVQSCNIKDEKSNEIRALLGQTFHKAHHTFADLSAKTPTGEDNPPIPQINVQSESNVTKCTAEKELSEDDRVIDKASSLIEPLLQQLESRISARISDQIVEMVKNKLHSDHTIV
ncbi:hypothetical protein SNE40_010522 [Patella caerulea]|uniref:Mitogen-activated protein kinase-binding protein 1 n=1 Tax=Patella caerulea TaxID=87958 RepID=A0AAN8JS37_PATCE